MGLVLKEWGYLVCNEYPLVEVGDGAPRPDISAFKNEEFDKMLSELRSRGVIWSGVFLEELQLFSCFGKQRYKARPWDSFEPQTKAEGVLVEIERTESQRKGRTQLQSYTIGTMGHFDEAYLGGPSLELVPGTMTFSREGELRFENSEPAYRPLLPSEYLQERKKNQLREVRGSLFIQLFKNLPLHQILSVCQRENEVQSYQDLLGSLTSAEPGPVLNALESG